MEVRNVVFTGLGRAMSDLDSQDGELAVSHNITRDNGSMRPIWVPENMMELEEGEELKYVHRTSGYKNYIVTGRERVTNHITVYHKYGNEYPDNYLRLVVVLEYPAASELNIYLKCLIAGRMEERTVTFPEGTLGKQVLSMGEQDTFIEARYEAQDSHYNYVLKEVDDSNNASDDAEWNENPPEFNFVLNFFTDDDPIRKPVVGIPSLDYKVKLSSIGNTLVMTSERGLEYILYKDGEYKPLGQKPPELDISFKLRLNRLSSSYDWAKIEVEGNYGKTTFDEEYRSEASLQIAAKVNEVLANAESENWFTSTFYVRWAYRMYNGLYMASPPVMMPLNGGIAPLLGVISSDGLGIYNPSSEGSLDEFYLEVSGYKGKLQYEIPGFMDVMERLKQWEDIVDGVELYVTRGTISYDQDGTAKGIVLGNDTDQCVSYGKFGSLTSSVYARNGLEYLSAGYYIDGMHKTDEDYREELLNNGVFYKLKSYKVDELKEGTVEVELEDNSLANLTTAPVLSKETDEYLEHDILYPEGVHVYNGRLNLYGVKSEKYNFPLSALSVFTNGKKYNISSYSVLSLADTDIEVDENGNPTGSTGGGGVTGDGTEDGNTDIEEPEDPESGADGGGTDDNGSTGDGGSTEGGDDTDSRVETEDNPDDSAPDDSEDGGTSGGGGSGSTDGLSYIKKTYRYGIRFTIGNEGRSVEVTNTNDSMKLNEPPLYIFYPDNSARRAVIERYNDETDGYEHAEVALTSHPALQGCYWFGGFDSLQFKTVDAAEKLIEESSEERRLDNGGKIYTSEVNNPFVFPLGGINTIGTGDIVGISTVTQALSQGQFGQFPLYVFSTDGIWAMEVGSDGLYSAVKALSRDVCINGESITQTDRSVLFVSERGVMQLDGSNIVCISDMMNGRTLDVDSVYRLNELIGSSDLRGSMDFMDYARKARMVYDYSNSRILLYRDDMDFCYVYSLSSTTWATLGIEIENAVNDYPDVYIQKGSVVKNLSTRIDYDDSGLIDTLIVSRPIKLGSDGYKTIYEMVSRGAMDRSKGAVLLWGSYDGMEYVLIKSVTGNRIYRMGGTAYRYFRIGVVGSMKVGESLAMLSLGFRTKYGNRLR